MTKIKKAFFCKNCGAESPKWVGQCPHCDEWNTYVEEVLETSKVNKHTWQTEDITSKSPVPLHAVQSEQKSRIITQDNEINRTLGGGLVPGSLVLLAGNPGIGKSTLLLQLALSFGEEVLYVSGEESAQQVKMRASRLTDQIAKCLILTETNVQKVIRQTDNVQPKLLIIDSIQTLTSSFIESPPGSISQIKDSTGRLLRFAKEKEIAIIIIGHINKEGSIAGPKVLEHMVDTVLQFEGNRNYNYRILRTLKNRFGSTDEIGIYEMGSEGLREVSNPSELLLSQSDERLSGSAVSASLEGQRPLLIETQALVAPAVYGNPQRSATGFDLRRLSMILAILEKRSGLFFGNQDVFLNIAGGVKIADPALDLAIAAALISSLEDRPIYTKFSFAGELGLTGEVRAVQKIEQRIQEADRLGFAKIIISKYNLKSINHDKYQIKIVGIGKIQELSDLLD